MSGLAWFLQLVLLGLGCFMILLVLLQRGRGGGLVGALGGPGGQSAFGTRAGDVFTRITVVVATLWVVSAGVAGMVLRGDAVAPSNTLPEDSIVVPDAPAGLPAGEPLGADDLAPAAPEVDTAPAAETDAADDSVDALDADAPGGADVDAKAEAAAEAADDAADEGGSVVEVPADE